MQKQSEKIDEFTRESELMNGRINELSLLNILRSEEFESKFAMMQAIVKEKSQKINELSVEIIERDIQCNKKEEESRAESRELGEQLRHVEMLAGTKDSEIEKLVGKLNALEGAVKEKEKIVQFLQGELKASKGDFKEARLMSRRYEEELEELREVMHVSEEKIKILKKEAVDNIEAELNHEFETQQLKKQMAKLESERTLLAAHQQASEQTIAALREAVGDMHAAGLARVEEIISHLTQPPSEDTAVFEVLAEEDDF
jgi:chromosome segregation ATPase